jgi:hypothetical protein
MRLFALCVVIGSLLLSNRSAAEPLILKCTASDGQPIADLKIDLGTLEMSFGPYSYKITLVTERFITAAQINDGVNVGGETWVLDRANGEYKRAAVSMMCVEPSCLNGSKLTASIYTGKCTPRLL